MSSNNETFLTDTVLTVLDNIRSSFLNQLPLIITALGLLGFLGNTITFLQPTLRHNSCCIYILCSSFVDIVSLFVNLVPKYVYSREGKVGIPAPNSLICKLSLFGFVFFPQLSMNLSIMSLISGYACTCRLTSRIRDLLQLKTVPYLIGITILISCFISLYAPILYDIIPGMSCASTNPTLNGLLYILIHGILTPFVMLITAFLTYRRFKQSRQRVNVAAARNTNRFRNQLIIIVFAQAIVTCIFAVQWISIYWYIIFTLDKQRSLQEWTATLFIFDLSNSLYYFINFKSFYLSTLTSHLFRKTFIQAVRRLTRVVA